MAVSEAQRFEALVRDASEAHMAADGSPFLSCSC